MVGLLTNSLTNSLTHSLFRQEIFTADNTFILDQVFRQKDPLFTNILNDLRRGTVSVECDNVMRRKAEEFRMGKVNSIGGMKPTKLYPVNAKCDSVNSTELEKLTSDSVPFVSVDWGHSPYLENLKVFHLPHTHPRTLTPLFR